jgi:hypothetical protein
MLLYILVISVATVIIILSNFFASGNMELNNLLWLSIDTVTGVIAIIAWDGLMAFLIRRALPTTWFSPGKKIFQATPPTFQVWGVFVLTSLMYLLE